MPRPTISRSTITVPSWPEFCPPTSPETIRNVEYHQQVALFIRMDALLRTSGVETAFLQARLAHQRAQRKRPMTPREAHRVLRRTRQLFRCHLLRTHYQLSVRRVSLLLVDQALWRAFCDLTEAQTPSKSTLDRFAHALPEATLRPCVDQLTQAAATPATAETLSLAQPLLLDVAWFDTTCVPANIHYPVDWLLLRDAAIALAQALACGRRHGLAVPDPRPAQRAMNHYCMTMAHVSRRPRDAAAARKPVVRAMNRLVRDLREQAEQALALLAAPPATWTLPPGRTTQIADRLRHVLTLLPRVLQQAHTRLLAEQPVDNADKLLSLAEPTAQVIHRGKTGQAAEFGHLLYLVEQVNGVILDWAFCETPVPDHVLVARRLPGLRATYPDQIHTAVTDRGCSSPAVRQYLRAHGMRDDTAPRGAKALAARQADPTFRQHQCRRAQTEGRIGILKNVFLGRPLRAKGFDYRALQVTWAIFTHNLWVLARLPTATDQQLAA